jgi:hypothetical protein
MTDVVIINDKDENFLAPFVSVALKIRIYYYYYYLTAVGLTSGSSSTVHIYTQTVHRIQRTEHT